MSPSGTITPFTVHISDERLYRIAAAINLSEFLFEDFAARLPPHNPDSDDFSLGIPPQRLEELIDHLRNGLNDTHTGSTTGGYDWHKWEKVLNDMGEHGIWKGEVKDYGVCEVHFVHKKSSNPNAIPLVLSHGWPGSFFEFYKLIPLLTQSYHLIIPSIPGYTFSKLPHTTTFLQVAHIATAFDAVARDLGYEKYVAQGGDWGSLIVRKMAALFPERCRAIHVNMIMTPPAKQGEGPEPNEIEKKGLDKREDFMNFGRAYGVMQGTTPYTLGAVLSMNPLALIAYISEKFYRWSSPTTHPSLDELLTSCLLYWFSGSITSSFWLYYNSSTLSVKGGGDVAESMDDNVQVPSAVGLGPYEISWGRKYDAEKRLVDLKQWKVLEKGGHFLALEVPDVLAKDIDAFYQSEDVKKSLEN